MDKIKITCDSTCDLTQELYEKYDVEVLPLGILLGEKLHFDGVDVHTPDVYAYADESGKLAKTSAVSPAVYEETFSKYVSQGYKVIHINISSEFSSCYQNACIAAEEVGNVYPIDSRNLSTGSGHLVIMARELADLGKSAEEIVDILNEAKTRLDVSFVLQTLEYMKMGGRCSSVAALGANMLKLRPEIRVTDGKMGVGRKYRGSLEKSASDYIRGALADRDDIDTKRVFFTHSGLKPEMIEKMTALIRELQPFEEVLITQAGCTISTHCGPECLGVLFFRKK